MKKIIEMKKVYTNFTHFWAKLAKFFLFFSTFFSSFSMKYLNNLKKVTQARIPLGFLSSSMYKEAIIMGLVWACVTFFL